jgi:hypothetical protein
MTTKEALEQVEAINEQLKALDNGLVRQRQEWRFVHRLISLVGVSLEVLMDYLTEKLKSEEG